MAGERPVLTPKLAAPTAPTQTSSSDGQPQANDNNQLRQFILGTPEATPTEQRHTAESDPAAIAPNNPTTAAPSFTPLSAAPSAAVKPTETAQQLQTRLETNSMRGIEGSVRLLNSYSNTAQLTAARSAQTASLRAPEIVEQVAVKLNHQAKTGLDTMTIQLRPADLGRIDVKLNFHDGSVSGTIIADSQTTLDLLVKDQRALERALQDSGLRTDSGALSFQLRDQSGQQAAQQERGSKRSSWQDIAFENSADVALVTESNGDSVISADRVNLRV
ncbi:MAG: flagellar hook-length control protein FliK [Alphaproteobacteria bacterium]|nr:flagellar hook-length control protein FliK [Alphaproteobacteria bacterium]